MLQRRADSRHRGHNPGMNPLQLFALLNRLPGGVLVFRAAIKLRLGWRRLITAALEPLLVADLPCRGWAWRRRQEISAAWDRDMSEMRYIEAALSEQPE
jgi:hypothetical protein